MKKVVLVDGNNLIFRSYFATAYSGKIMRNSKGLPTNALYGFVSMINKIISEENPEYMMVAFDIGKNFRKEKYDFYKEGRSETPDDLKLQMPIARRILQAMGITYLELAPYEADDIIGTVAAHAEENPEYYSLIVSSDKDLLQLISFETEVKLLKQTGFIRYNEESFKKDYGIEPIRIIDLKALMGDSSDNIPGVKGIGEKTALKLLQDYQSLDGIYANIADIKGKTQEKLINDKTNAYMSYELATIFKQVPIPVDFEEFRYNGPNIAELRKIYEELEFHSFLKNMVDVKTTKLDNNFIEVNSVNELVLDDKVAFYLEVDNLNYHQSNILGLSISDQNHTYFIKKELVKDAINFIKDKDLMTYDLKKSLVVVDSTIKCDFDLMVASYLVDYPASLDIALLMNNMGEGIDNFETLKKNDFADLKSEITLKSRFIYEYSEVIQKQVSLDHQEEIFKNIEMPLIYVLAKMEINGFKYEKDRLQSMKTEIINKIANLEKEIYELAGEEFNISSPKQLGVVLFEHLQIAHKKKQNGSYKTDVKTLQKYAESQPIVAKILEYRNLNKLLNTYIEALDNYVLKDGKIHTIFNQTLTRTGRLSSMDPNLQNIPVREEYGKKIRMAFVPSHDLILSADYSQIELRILAHISNCQELIDCFKRNEDIHTMVAADIHGISQSEVTKTMRSMAKAVIFGIVYGISGFGLGENLQISTTEAKKFIEKYYELYPGVKDYMNNIVKSAYETGEVKTLFGRIRKIKELQDHNYMVRMMGERMALNTPIQGTSADIMKMAMILVDQKIAENHLESKMILQIHDEIILDVKKEEVPKLKEILKDAMENVVTLNVPLKIDINVGSDWYQAK